MVPIDKVIKDLKYRFSGWNVLPEQMKRKIINKVVQYWHKEQEEVKKKNKEVDAVLVENTLRIFIRKVLLNEQQKISLSSIFILLDRPGKFEMLFDIKDIIHRTRERKEMFQDLETFHGLDISRATELWASGFIEELKNRGLI